MTVPDVVVVGAGLAGLTAAHDLAARGADVLVLEARGRIGGRVRGVPLAPGLVTDGGAAYLGERHTAVRELLERFGLAVVSADEDGDSVFSLPGRSRSPFRVPPYDAAGLGELFEALHDLTAAVDPERPHAAAAELHELTAGQWIRRRVADPGALAFAPLYLGQLVAAEMDDLSALCLGYYLRSGGGLRYLNAFRSGAQEFRVAGGAQRIAESLAATLPRPPVLDTPVVRVEAGADGVSVVTRHGVHRAGVAVVALPPPLAAGVCGTAADGAVRGRAVKTHLLFDRPAWRDHGLSGWSLNDRGPLMYTVDVSPADGPGVLTGFATGQRAEEFAALPAPRRETVVRQQLAAVFPEIPQPREVVVTDWVTSRYSSGCYATLWKPGRWGGPPGPAGPAGRVVRCGTETSTEFYGFMEGAVRSGRRAAEQALTALAQPLQEDRR